MKKIHALQRYEYPYVLFRGSYCYINPAFQNDIRISIQKKNMEAKSNFILLNIYEKK